MMLGTTNIKLTVRCCWAHRCIDVPS